MRKLTGDGESASSREPQDWHAIDWHRVEQFVRTTQQRIAKATLDRACPNFCVNGSDFN